MLQTMLHRYAILAMIPFKIFRDSGVTHCVGFSRSRSRIEAVWLGAQ